MGSVKLFDIKGPRGYSAYELAVQNGFIGTMADWLDSLEGGGGESAAALAAHVASERPHVNAESGYDFVGWFNAQIT